MKLSEAQKGMVLDRLQGFFNTACSCTGREWLLNDNVFEVREFMSGNLVVGGASSVFPVITVTCRSCGHTYFFSAILLGVVKKSDEQSK